MISYFIQAIFAGKKPICISKTFHRPKITEHFLQNEKLTHARLAIRRQSFFVTVTGAEETPIRIFADFCAPTIVNRTLVDIYTKIRRIISRMINNHRTLLHLNAQNLRERNISLSTIVIYKIFKTGRDVPSLQMIL